MSDFIHQIKLPEEKPEPLWKTNLWLKWWDIKDDIKRFIPYWIRDGYQKIHEFLWPRQKWLTDKVGKSWRDWDSIVSVVCREFVIFFVEKDGALRNIEWEPEMKGFIEKYYDIAKNQLPALEKQLEDEYAAMPRIFYDKGMTEAWASGELKGRWDKTDLIDAEIAKLEDELINFVISNRKRLWT